MTNEGYLIIIADDHKLLSDGIELIIHENNLGRVAAKTSNGKELLESLKNLRPDLVIMDMDMPFLNGLEAAEVLKLGYPDLKVLIISQHESVELVKRFYNLGVEGYLPKTFDLQDLIQGIRKIKNGERVFPLLDGKSLDPRSKQQLKVSNNGQYKLTGREVEIIRFIAKGFTSRQMADKLFLSEFTINTHRRNIMRKLDFKNVAGLINFARENHLL